jgi:hypothetical protein
VAWPVRPTPHRLVLLLSLVLVLLVALPEVAAAKHRRPIFRNSLASFVEDPVEPRVPPATFTCEWLEEAPYHDYACAAVKGAAPEFRLGGSQLGDSFPVPNLLFGDRTYDLDGDQMNDGDVQGWEGFPPQAHPHSAKEFTCTGDQTFEEANYQCSFTFLGFTHRFTVADIVSVAYEGESEFEPFFVPCDLSAPCIELPPPPPDTSITSGPSGSVRAKAASFGFASSRAGSTFECRLDGGQWHGCSDPSSYSGLSEGGHRFEVRAGVAGDVDPSPAERGWRVDTTGPSMGLSGRAVRLTRRGVARLRIRCLDEQGGICAGRVVLTSVRGVSASQRRRVTFGRKRFTVAAGRTAGVRVKLSRRHRRMVVRRGSVRVRANVRARDRLGNVAVTSRTFSLLAPRN